MTYEEAINCIKGCICYKQEPCNDGICKSAEDRPCAIDVAIEALEKQIPKEPIRNTEKIHKAWIESVALCPTCINYVGNYDAKVIDAFCRECGQAIGEVE